MSHRFEKDGRIMKGLGCLWRSRCLSLVVKVGIMEGMVAPRVLCGTDSLMLNHMERGSAEVFDMNWMRKTLDEMSRIQL